jgi:serine-type D-Ala-D-Ala carboxypeptidase/endopeptidase
MRLICQCLFIVVMAAGVANGSRASAAGLDLRQEITPLAQPLIDDGQAVGLVVGVFRDGKSQILGFGETEKGSGQKPTGRTVYEIGSATKAMTGVLLADMARRGEVKLDDPLQQYLPEGVKLKLFEDEPITLAHVATHTSGLPRLPENMKPADPTNPYADYTPELMHEFLGEHQLERAPGKYEYSNLAMGMLGYELARLKNQTYEELLLERITKPLGMKDTSITLSPSQRKRLAPPYNAGLKLDKNWDLPTLAGAGGVRSTAADMLVILKANLADDDKPLTQSMKLSHEKRHTADDGLAIGLGWHIARDGITWWHNGMTGGYASWMAFVPQYNAAVVVLSNTASPKITALGEQLTRVACGMKVAPPKQREPVEVALDTLKSYEGTYAITPQFALTVTVEDGKLMVQATGQSKLQVYAESPTEFFYKVVDAQLTFEPGPDGKAKSVTLHQNGADMKAQRQ